MELDFELTNIGGKWAIALDIESMRSVLADLHRFYPKVKSHRRLYNEVKRMHRQTRTELKKAYRRTEHGAG